MGANTVGVIALIVALTLLSGFADAQGFFHAARIWTNGKLVVKEVVASSLGFGFGILMYWIAIRYLNNLGVLSPEIQTLGWFAVTIVGVAILSGEFFKWQAVDRIVAVGILAGIGWLLFRTGG